MRYLPFIIGTLLSLCACHSHKDDEPELKQLVKAKAESDKLAAVKKAEEDKKAILDAVEKSGKSLEEILEMLGK